MGALSPSTDFRWLIETFDGRYLRSFEDFEVWTDDLTTDANDALWWPDKASAESLMAKLGCIADVKLRATEHGFISRAKPDQRETKE